MIYVNFLEGFVPIMCIPWHSSPEWARAASLLMLHDDTLLDTSH